MPKFDDYTQKTTPEDTDIALILDKTANVNKKTPFSGIWTWIVNKMTNAVIQNLQTTNKTVIGSINELNSKSGAVTDENILNAVEMLKSEVWSTYNTGIILETFIVGGPLFCVIGYKNSDDYGAVILFSYFSNRASFVRVASGSWSTPVYV